MLQADVYQAWVDGLTAEFKDNILEFDSDASRVWGTLLSHEKKDPDTIDKQIAAIALVHDLVVVTRDKGTAFSRLSNVKVLNPFSPDIGVS